MKYHLTAALLVVHHYNLKTKKMLAGSVRGQLRRSSLDKLFQVGFGCYTQHKSSIPIGHYGEVVGAATSNAADEKGFQLLQGGVHRDHLVYLAASLKLLHRLLDVIRLPHRPVLEHLLQARDVEVAK